MWLIDGALLWLYDLWQSLVGDVPDERQAA